MKEYAVIVRNIRKGEHDMELKGSKTEKNLQNAFAGESQARNKYTYFAEKAREEGYEQIADLFLETARMNRNMQRSGSRHCAEARSPQQLNA